MEELLLHGWHNVVAGFGDRQERLVEIEHNKPLNQIPLRERLMERAISESDAAEFDAVNAKRQAELDAIEAKWRPEWDAVNAKRQAELDAIEAKWQAKWDVVSAKWQPEWDAVNAKRQSERDAFHARVCVPNCPWDGQTIFTHRKRNADGSWGDWCMRDEGEAVPLDERII